ncbi:transposase [Micromonospora sp. NPDC003776]
MRREFAAQLRNYLWGQRLWSPSHFAESSGGTPLAVAKEYIDNQKRPGA